LTGASAFVVDISVLEGLARELGEACGSMSTALNSMMSASRAETGEASLDSACGHFQDKWSYGLQLLGGTTQSLQEGVEATTKAYRTTEEGIARSLSASHTSGLIEHKRGGIDGTPVEVPKPPGRLWGLPHPHTIDTPIAQSTGDGQLPVAPIPEMPAVGADPRTPRSL
jgi:hypothetical protein